MELQRMQFSPPPRIPEVLIDSDIFYKCVARFVNINPSRCAVLLLLDGHTSDLSGETLLLAKENHAHFLVFPPHSTHEFQRWVWECSVF
jgi:hypothetical protein